MRRRFLLTVVAIAAGGVLLPACGGDDESAGGAPKGSPENPLVAKMPDSASSETPSGAAPGYQELVERQSRRPGTEFTPCNLVSKGQARAMFGAPIQDPVEAPQGPTCIYRTQAGKGFVTLAVQTADFERLRPQLRRSRRVEVAERFAYCGEHGQEMLYVPLSHGQVLSVAAPCSMARKFAATALRQLPA
jgi:hypothetical protein